MSIYLSKSKYCRGKQCAKRLWLENNKPEFAGEIEKEDIFKIGTEVGETAKDLFGDHINIEYNADLKKMVEETQKYIKNKIQIITEASFIYNNNFCSVDLLKNESDGIVIYEVKCSTAPKEIYEDDIAYQVYVLKNLGYNVKGANLVHINNKYVRNGKLELDKLFVIEDITITALKKQNEVEKKIQELEKYLEIGQEPNLDIGVYCFEPYSCPFWDYCTQKLPEKNVFSLRNFNKNKKFNLYYRGIVKYEQLLDEIKNKKAKQQIIAELTDEVTINKEKIKEVVENLYYPLYFLDFETFMQAIPQFDGIRPYMQIPFQYSLHFIEKEGGELKHTEFLAEAGKDPRRKLAEQLVKDIPKNVCVTAYNMKFEKMVIKELAEEFEDLKDHLLNIRDNIQDLMTPFFKRWYYSKSMDGSYSIKSVLPTLYPNVSEYDYHNLEKVHNGGEASSIYADLQNRRKEEQEEIRKALLEYCKLDTLAMVKVWEKLKEIKERK